LGAKARSSRSQAGGGVATTNEPALGNTRQALPAQVILELARLGQDVTRLAAGQPQDIEWAWADGRLFLLQARPITSLYPLPDGLPAEPLQVLFSLNHVQGMLDPFTPLGQDAILRVFVALAHLFDQEIDPRQLRRGMAAGERIYLNIAPPLRHGQARVLAKGILGAVEPGSGQVLASLLSEPALGVSQHGISPATLRTLARFASTIAPRVAAALRNPTSEQAAMQHLLDAFVAEASERARHAATLGERMALWRSIYREFADRVSLHLLPPVMAGIASFILLRRLAQQTLGSDQLALEAARSLPNNVTTEMDLALWTVTQVIRSDPESAAHVGEADPAAVVADFQSGQLPMPAQVAMQAFLDRYGLRGLAEIDLGRARWREDPTHVVHVVQSYLRIDDPMLAPDAVFRRGAAAADDAIDRLVRAMPNPAQARLARLLASRMRALAGLRETPKFTIMRVMAIVRQMLLTSGQELADTGVLAQTDDVFFLYFEELEALAAGDRRDWRAVVAERRRAYGRELLRRQVPRILLSDGRAFYEGLGATGGEEGVLTGSPVSPGVVEGVVQVVLDPRHAQLAPGEILVCPGTDPSWTPLFLAAGGLVMEVGGLMTHGSVVAREYGIPAVVGVHEATTRLRTGQHVRVDGTAGRVVMV
jgi:pyruvate,water dikinase